MVAREDHAGLEVVRGLDVTATVTDNTETTLKGQREDVSISLSSPPPLSVCV